MEKEDLYEAPYIDPSVHKYKRKKKIKKIIILSVLGVIAIVYVCGAGFFYTHFSGDTTLNGYDISYKSVSEVEDIINNDLAAYTLDIEFSNGTETLRVGDGTLDMQLSESISSVRARQNCLIWFVNLFDSYDMEVKYNAVYDEDGLKSYLADLSYFKSENMKPSVDARVRMSEGEAYILDDVTGTELDVDKAVQTVYDALCACDSSVDMAVEACYIPAAVTKDSTVIQEGLDNANDYLNIDAEYDFSGYKIKLTRDELSTMAYVDSRGKVAISRTNVEGFVKNLAEKYDTCQTERNFRTHNNRTIKVYGGSYGWKLDTEKEAEELYNYLSAGRDFTKEPVCEHRGYTYNEDGDIGDTYVEVDLKNQKVYVYVDGIQKVETDCVSGNTSAGRNTPGGLYSITYKATNVVLRGQDYESPVTYWIPFNGGIGLHDATWRSRFGGSIYYYNGSHGCVNLPYSAAGEIYSLVEAGMPVVCYWD